MKNKLGGERCKILKKYIEEVGKTN